jgi:hypothetical protein
MECGIFNTYLKENDSVHGIVPDKIKAHVDGCETCQKQYRFALLLSSQKCILEKAPDDILPNIENAILGNIKQLKDDKTPFRFKFKPMFKPLYKPAFAGFFALMVAVVSYTFQSNKNIGYVENLSKRFKIAQFENIKSGDVLYTGDNTTASISLKSKNELQIHHNTIVKVKGSRHIALSRGEISLLSGNKELQIETPDGVLLAKNTNTKINTVARLENGVLKTETTCIVLNGSLIIKNAFKEIVLNQGQKAVFSENCSITYQKQLTAAESELEKSVAVKQTVFSAVQSLCECIHAFNYEPGKKGDHLQLFGKEVNENKFKVHVFWQEKGLNELVYGPLVENNKTSFTRLRRSDG